MKTVGGFRRTRYLGVERTGQPGGVRNQVRLAKLLDEPEAATSAVRP